MTSIKSALIDLDVRRYVPSLAAAVARERAPHRIFDDTIICSCSVCEAERTRRGQVRTSTGSVPSTEQVGTPARTEDGTNGDLTISLSDAAFLVALGVALTLAVELAAFVAWAGAQ